MKPLPCAASKGRIYNHFNELSTLEVRYTMNEIIMKNRQISIEEARKVKTLYKSEVMEVMRELGDVV